MTPLPLLTPAQQEALTVARHRHRLAAAAELELITMLLEDGWSWRQTGHLLGYDSGHAIQARHRWLIRQVRLRAVS